MRAAVDAAPFTVVIFPAIAPTVGRDPRSKRASTPQRNVEVSPRRGTRLFHCSPRCGEVVEAPMLHRGLHRKVLTTMVSNRIKADARAHMAQNPGTSYQEALRAVAVTPKSADADMSAAPAEITTIWTVTYIDDDVADEIGSRVFATEAEAEAWADRYVGDDADEDGEDRHLYAYVEKHEVLDTNWRVADLDSVEV